ncbi:hypothetical protein Aglo03_16580 [Actinokineospora globicatena]|uniref:Uncharacterized protein n=1 Tax=Actinokineospora globicatena TaxID=103729 RepID=A0A9W6V6Y5_9PSEU|nr:hypothetical protein Aglo03_16580 [Actinokineospora globicatena]
MTEPRGIANPTPRSTSRPPRTTRSPVPVTAEFVMRLILRAPGYAVKVFTRRPLRPSVITLTRPGGPMPADLSALTQELDWTSLRGHPAPDTFHTRLRAGIETWDAAIADLDAGGTAADALDQVVAAFDMTAEFAAPTTEALEMAKLDVGTTAHRFLVLLIPIRRDLVRANHRPVTQLRKAVALERRTHSRWRSPDGRAAALVDRDLQLEEVRVTAKAMLEEAATLAATFTRWRHGS